MADSQLQRAIHQCPCSHCDTRLLDEVARDHEAINRVVAALDERQRRLFAGLLALHQGRGGIVAVAQVTGLSRTTIRRGIRELQSGVGTADLWVRRPGGGRPSLEKKRPRL
jgi:DNA-binding phage protein